MYDTSDIRKGLKIMLDGSPYPSTRIQLSKIAYFRGETCRR